MKITDDAGEIEDQIPNRTRNEIGTVGDKARGDGALKVYLRPFVHASP